MESSSVSPEKILQARVRMGKGKGRGRSQSTRPSPEMRMQERFHQRGVLEGIVTVEADCALLRFPDLLKQQLQDYFRRSGDSQGARKPWAGPSFKISQASTSAEPVHFVEPDTGAPLYAAHYHYGDGADRLHIAVVQGHQGSNFNDGQPAIVAFHSRKHLPGGHSTRFGSRWIVWTPGMVGDRLIVDRLPIETGISASSHEPAAFGSKIEKGPEDDVDDVIFVKRQPRSVSLELASPSVTIFHQTDIRSVSSKIESSDVTDSIESRVTFDFRSALNDKVRLTKSLEQCNSVSKIFAYAYKADISNADVMVLEGVIDGFPTMKLVRDDNEDFKDFLRLIEKRRKSIEEDAVMNITIIPATY